MIIFVHRKDLRLHDLQAFDYIAAAKRRTQVLHLFILDPALLKKGRHAEHSGQSFLRHLSLLASAYAEHGRELYILSGEPAVVLDAVTQAHPVEEIVYHKDYTPYALVRDRAIRSLGEQRGIPVTELSEGTAVSFPLLHDIAGRKEPFKVFTPFYRRWLPMLESGSGIGVSPVSVADLPPSAVLDQALEERFTAPFPLPEPIAHSFDELDRKVAHFLEEGLQDYESNRDRFAIEDGASKLSRHLNAGALSVRKVYEAAHQREQSGSWIRQLAWRDFYQYQAMYDPRFFRYEREFDLSPLSAEHLQAWAEGRTGIPIIDAAMTELNHTGEMPNRLRMVTAMFLTKNLLCPFTLGETYFRCKLADYDNALNRGGWLWCASLGFDAAPYFRIMNPVTQSERYDPAGDYIRRWLPELRTVSDRAIHKPRPHSIVDLSASRTRAIEIYKQILAGGSTP